ncbi:carboxylating nicotinate-nucleotide diphosphorylase [Salinicola rhizosphaerae]|uniref:nicotinate-nucleotide diphosphorylase (carboxylating) n=1 Tax=Salinicola rhizosphaerae TaxID=1443141 RepID=A0ABQ3DZN5_9GAMM|nr:carboxylating nicotinate-nucleotide diphosphorylase [Salinicola rhizosphaerae]GHB21469.1 nicotinate-nucleotide diphosphorylase (carboxylating) [Salinicola rhizosphaerae]
MIAPRLSHTPPWPTDPLQLDRSLDSFLREDIGHVDLTSTLMIDEALTAEFEMVAREPIVVAGLAIAARAFTLYEARIEIEASVEDGASVDKGRALMKLTGPARGLLTVERTALNLVQHLSGIATLTAQYVERIAGTGAQLVDTRKTTPGLRALEKYAVACGGGRNHRLGLDSGIMLKDNHIAVCGSIGAAVARAKARVPVLTRIEVECDRLDQVEEALAAGADLIMLDNMTLEAMRTAVERVDGRVPLEASGGVRLETIREIAETGVDFISVGRITQSAPAVDIGMDESLAISPAEG